MKLPKIKKCKCRSFQCYVLKHKIKSYSVTCTDCNTIGPIADDPIRAIHKWNKNGCIYGHTALNVENVLSGDGLEFEMIRRSLYFRRSPVFAKII